MTTQWNDPLKCAKVPKRLPRSTRRLKTKTENSASSRSGIFPTFRNTRPCLASKCTLHSVACDASRMSRLSIADNDRVGIDYDNKGKLDRGRVTRMRVNKKQLLAFVRSASTPRASANAFDAPGALACSFREFSLT